MASQTTTEIVPLQPEHRQSVINLLISSFFLQEPLNAALKFELPHEVLSWADHIIDGALRDQCSFVAINTSTPNQELVGIILNGVSKKTGNESIVVPSEKLNYIFSLMDQLLIGHDLFELYKTDRLFHCDIINVDENQRGQNLSARLIKAALEKAQQLNIKGGFVVCTSLFSKKAFMRHRFQFINEILYSDYDNGRLTDMGIHDRCTLLAKEL